MHAYKQESGQRCQECRWEVETLGLNAEGAWVCSTCHAGHERPVVVVCTVCGGKYRPAGGPCIHEHPRGVLEQRGPVCCLVCGVSWYPGHACIAQPTAKDIEALGEWGALLTVMDELMDGLRHLQRVAAPAAWEVM